MRTEAAPEGLGLGLGEDPSGWPHKQGTSEVVGYSNGEARTKHQPSKVFIVRVKKKMVTARPVWLGG